MSKTLRIVSLAAACALGATSIASSASARSQQDERYTPSQTWNAAIRMLRVDLGYEILERDRETGFALFVYKDGAVVSNGSLEVVSVTTDGVETTRIIVQLARMPSYTERFLLTRLSRKLREEYGEPPVVRRPPPAQRPQDPPADPPRDQVPPPSDQAPPKDSSTTQ